jgi:hypothetical protein
MSGATHAPQGKSEDYVSSNKLPERKGGSPEKPGPQMEEADR